MVESVSVRFKNASVSKNAFEHSYAVECGNRLRVGVRAKTPACRGLRVGPSKSGRFQGAPEACLRLHANFGEAWRSLANPQHHIHNNLPDIHQSSGEGPAHSPEFRWRCLLHVGGLQNVPN